MTSLAFSSIPVNGIVPKPRTGGLSMMQDLGIPLTVQQDFLVMAGDYLDYAKIAVGISRVLTEHYLREKIASYTEHNVTTFPGGLFLEYAYSHGLTDAYFEGCHSVGYPAIEVSDNYLEFAPGAKSELIRRASADGLQVIAEVGHKEGDTSVDDMARDINESLEAGASVVLIEAGEILGQRQDRVITMLKRDVPLERVLIEVPGHYLPGAQADTPFRTMTTLIKTIGIDVNLANLTPDDIMNVQSHRIEIASNIRLGGYTGPDG